MYFIIDQEGIGARQLSKWLIMCGRRLGFVAALGAGLVIVAPIGSAHAANDGNFGCTWRIAQAAIPAVQQDDAAVRITRWDFARGAAAG